MICPSVATATLLQLAACTDPAALAHSSSPETGSVPARFADASPEQLWLAIIAGTGWLIDLMPWEVRSTLDEDGSGCPQVSSSGDTTIFTTECVRADGTRRWGQVIVKNMDEDDHDPNQPAEMLCESYRAEVSPTDTLALDGAITFRPDESKTASLTMAWEGAQIAYQATWRRIGSEMVTADAGSTIEVSGLGFATIAGSWKNEIFELGGTLSLHGADVLEVDFDDMVDDCAPITVDGNSAGQFCPWEP